MASDWVAEQNEPNPWVGKTSRVVGQQLGEPVGRGVLVAHQVVGVLVAEQVGASGGAVQQRAAGEDTADRSSPSSRLPASVNA